MNDDQQEVRAILDLGLPILLVVLIFFALNRLIHFFVSSLF